MSLSELVLHHVIKTETLPNTCHILEVLMSKMIRMESQTQTKLIENTKRLLKSLKRWENNTFPCYVTP